MWLEHIITYNCCELTRYSFFFLNTWWGTDMCFLSWVFFFYRQFLQWSVNSVWLAALQLGIIVSWVLILCLLSLNVFYAEMYYLLSHSFPFLSFLSLWLSFFGALSITCITMMSMTFAAIIAFSFSVRLFWAQWVM